MFIIFLLMVAITFTVLSIVWTSNGFINVFIKTYLIAMTVSSWMIFIHKAAPTIKF
jgi:hypothetical protein